VTPLELLALICFFAIVRVAISLRPQTVPPSGMTAGDVAASPSTRTVVREYLDAFIVAGLVALFLITFVVRTFYIPSGSMEPTLQIHDVLLVNEFEYRFSKPHRGDIVVFPPPIPSSNDFIKRVIGVPGDQLRIHQGVVYRNARFERAVYRTKSELRTRDQRLRRLRGRHAARSAERKHSAQRSVAGAGPDPQRVLFHDGRQPK
jgi:signal peptidase I